MHPDIVVIAHDIRSTHNVGSLLRTCDGLGVSHVYLTGYTPFPVLATDDPRLPHLAQKLTRQIHKTALGAEATVAWSAADIDICLAELQKDGYMLVALEQSPASMPLPTFRLRRKAALLLGREVEGLSPDLLARCDAIVEIPMAGQKESFNVVQAAAMALYQLRFG